MEFVGNFIQITIPRKLMPTTGSGPLASVLVAATKCAGGMTLTPVQGTWFDSEGVEYAEENYTVRWNFSNENRKRMMAYRDDIVQRMFEAGEKAVLVERYFEASFVGYQGYSADIYEA